jgi:hypothetical protein
MGDKTGVGGKFNFNQHINCFENTIYQQIKTKILTIYQQIKTKILTIKRVNHLNIQAKL